MIIIRFYADGLRLFRWSLQLRWRWIRGFAVGIEHRRGPHSESKWTHSSLTVSLVFFAVVVEHANTIP
jgi:hypothetical protein